ncbi:methyl-accepting chemotaxis protein [Celerinatantimonas yamalensis]|uniref:Methyl-accepting chemotaxis protein n=1 Tax=Celerinatantimonas yamalensis TaxID=559956 RepID=A0ABW9G2V3_9GAMM
MFSSLKMRIYLLAFGPFLLISIISAFTQFRTLNTVNDGISKLVKNATIETEKNRLVTIIDSAFSIIQPDINKPGVEGLDDALALLKSYNFDTGRGYLYAYDINGLRLMDGSGSRTNINMINSKDTHGNFFIKNIINSAVNQNGFSQYYFPKPGETKSSSKYSYARYIPQWNLVIGTGFYMDSVEKVVSDIKTSMSTIKRDNLSVAFIILAVVFALITAMVLLSSKAVLGPLFTLSHAVKQLASGHGDLTQKLPASSIDILNRISSDFNTFLATMSVDISHLKRSSNALITISVNSNDQRDKLAEVSDRQISETNLVASAIEEMKANSNEIAENAESTRLSAESTEAEIQQMLQQVNLSSHQLKGLSLALNTVEQSIEVLGENVAEIDLVLGVIQGISEQTNLLALNAAIEAARAGEQGRGFAVVADEVRNLALRSHQSTVKIKEILEKLQQSTVRATEEMHESLNQRECVVGAMAKINEIINSSTQSIKNLTQMNVQVSTAAYMQSQVANDIAKNVVGIAELAKNIGKDSAQTAEQIALLENQSQIIKGISDKFKV